jgi:hypothetical protein
VVSLGGRLAKLRVDLGPSSTEKAFIEAIDSGEMQEAELAALRIDSIREGP